MVRFTWKTLKAGEAPNVFHTFFGQKKYPGLIGIGGKPLHGIVREQKGIYKGLSEKQWKLVQTEFLFNPRWRDEYNRPIVLIQRLPEPQRILVRLPKSPKGLVNGELKRLLR